MNYYGQSGFENSSGMNQNFEFNSSATSKFGPEKPLLSSLSNVSKPRMAKSRKSLNSRSMGSSETQKMDQGFNPFHPVSNNLSGFSYRLQSDENDASMNRSKHLNSSSGNAFIEETESQTDLNIDSQSGSNLRRSASLSGIQQPRKCVENSLPSELADSMKKLNLGGLHCESSKNYGVTRGNFGGNREPSLGVSGGHNVGGLFGATLPSDLELPNDFEKLNLKNTDEASGQNFIFSTTSRRDFVFGSSRKNNDTVASGIESTLHEEIKNLNIEDYNKNNGAQKGMNFKKNNTFDSRGRGTGSGSGGVMDPMILDAMGRLNIEGGSEGSSDHTHPDSFSSLRKGGLGNTNKDASGEGNHTISVIREEGKDSSVPQVSELQSDRVFGFSSKNDGLRAPNFEFRTPDSKCNLLGGLNHDIEFSATKGSTKDTLSQGSKGKLKESSSILLSLRKSSAPKENTSEVYSEPSESCSPMDVSPYRETNDDAESAREPSLTSDNQTSTHSHVAFYNDVAEDLITAKECVDINEGNGFNHDEARDRASSLERSTSADETQSFKSVSDELDRNGENEVESNREGQSSDQTQFDSASGSVSSGGSSFTFSASSPFQGQATSSIRFQKKKNRMKVGSDIYIPTRTILSDPRVAVLLSPVAKKDGLASPLQKGGINQSVTSSTSKILGASNIEDTKREATSMPAASRVAQETCEKWRLRGNQAYSSGDLEKAEDYYTQGLSCIPQNEKSKDCLRASVLCYSNRAATRMSLGRMREALQDCMAAAELDPNFFRVHLRAANCFLALGEVADASQYFQKLLQSTNACVELKLIQEASEGVQKAQKVSECMDRSAELLQRTLSDVEAAVGVITDALVISPYSEQLLERKAEALFMLRRYEEVMELCVKTLKVAEKNSPLLSANGQSSDLEAVDILKNYYFQLWRYRLIFKSNFHLGKLEEAHDFLEKQEQWRSMIKKYGNGTLESLIPQLPIARELIHHKCAGNEAFQAGKHNEAVEHYTAALSLNVESRPFAAVCFGNRAAAFQAMAQITDAIADCSLAIALDGNYSKAISRRASLFEMIRDYEQAAKDLHRLVSLLTMQAEGKANQLGASSTTSSLADLRQARQRLYQMEEQAKKGISLNFYLILGVQSSVTAADLKKAYRKAALRHHPDKAGQSLARSESGDDGLGKEIAEEVYKDADRLFKMIGEAYAVLSDPSKRSQYDIEEETRNGQKKSSSSTTSRTHTDANNPADRSGVGGGRQWRETWRTSGNPYHRGFEPTRPGGR